MKKLLLVLPFFMVSCFEQERNVADFKTGKFEFVEEINGKKQITIFERSDSLQIEKYDNKVDSASVRWVSDSEFILQKLHPKSMKERKAISMKILSTTKTGYIFEYAFVGEEKKQQGFVTKLK
jgi:hypothetical protein